MTAVAEGLPGRAKAAAFARPAVGLATYGGLFFTTLSTLTYEILLTRIFSVTMGYHFAFVAVSVALFGMTVGALAVYLLPERFPQERTKERMSQASLLFSLTVVLSFLGHLAIPFDPAWSPVGIASASATYLVISVPFVFSGIAVCLALTRYAGQVGRMYAADLAGAALGTVTLIWLLRLLGDGPSAVAATAGLAALGAWSFGAGEGHSPFWPPVGAWALLLFALAAGNAALVQSHHPLLHLPTTEIVSAQGPLRYERWNAISRITVVGDPSVQAPPFGWGLSSTYPGGDVSQLYLVIDAAAGTPLTRYDGDRADIAHLAYDVTNLAHYLRPDADVFVVGSGGGRDVLSALLFEQRSVTAVDLNADILSAVNDEYGDYTGHLDEQPGVTFVNDEARSYLARSDERYDILQISLIDTWAATAAGAFALSENSLYTVEAWETFLERLSERGVLSATRWFAREGSFASPGPVEAYRLTALATAALRNAGVEEPRAHLMLFSSEDAPYWPGVGTLLVSREPFSPADVSELTAVAGRMRFETVLTPADAGADPRFAEIAAAEDPTAVDLGFPADISPPRDDRPFFFQMVRFQDLFNPSLYGGFNDYLAKPVLVLFSLAVAVLILTAACILLPLALTTSRQALRGMLPLVVFFCAIGLGFLLLEVSQLQRLIIFLGHPTYALSVVLFSLLLSSGLGSLASERLPARLGLRLLAPFAALLVVLLAFGLATPAVIDRFEASVTPVRILAAVGILAPMGFLLGMPFPLGMKVASLRPNAPTPFFWGINGAASVCASVLGIAIAMGWGISTAFWSGCACYAVAAVALGTVVVRGRL